MTIRGWYVAEDDLLTTVHPRFPERLPIREGETLTLPPSVVPRVCEAGYHASPRLLDALGYRAEGRITLVEVFGDVDVGSDKVAGRSRKTLRIVPKVIADRECRLFAADVAERLLEAESKAGWEPAAEAFAAVEVARRFALGDADWIELEEALDACSLTAVHFAASPTYRPVLHAAVAAAKVQAPDAAYIAAAWAAEAASIAASRAAEEASEPRWSGTRVTNKLSRELENRLLDAMKEGEEP